MQNTAPRTIVIGAIEGEYRRYRTLAEKALEQMTDDEVQEPGDPVRLSEATIVRHIAGNLHSRFTDFLTSDGEKPWRDREGELAPRSVTRVQLLEAWTEGWHALFHALSLLTDAQLGDSVTIRGQPLTISEALHRSLAHTAYHVGQIVWSVKARRGDAWESLSIPRGATEAYNRAPTRERPPAG
jgi:hypothetical protein